MKKTPSLLTAFCLVLLLTSFTGRPAGALGGAGSFHALLKSRSLEEDSLYRVFFVITSNSDWTTIQIAHGGLLLNAVYEVTKGGEAPECRCWVDVHEDLIGMSKKSYDTTLVRINVTAILYIEEGLNLIVEIKKGDIGYTSLEIYSFNGRTPVSVQKITNENTIAGDPENLMEISVMSDTLITGGPLPLLSTDAPDLVWAFYYPWYYEDEWSSDIFIDTPSSGPYTSSDPGIIEKHIQQAQSAGIDGFIVSWWGEGSYTDQNLGIILDIAQKYNFKITIYFETLEDDGPRSERELKRMFLSFFEKYGEDPRYYRIEGNPVIFVWAVNSLPPSVWESVLSDVEQEGYSAVYIADTTQPDYLYVFDGLHTYGTVGIDDLPLFYKRTSLLCGTYGYLNAAKKQCIWAATVCPGYDDRNIPGRSGLYQPRDNGKYYKKTGEAALASDPDWLLITSFNEWPENTHIEPSVRYGVTYLEITSQITSQFKEELLQEPVDQPEQDESETTQEESQQEPEASDQPEQDESETLAREELQQEADNLFEQGKEAFEEGNYEEALSLFQEAKEIYESTESEKAKECDELIKKTQEKLESGFCLGTFLITLIIGITPVLVRNHSKK